jgi:hypothetical protein
MYVLEEWLFCGRHQVLQRAIDVLNKGWLRFFVGWCVFAMPRW